MANYKDILNGTLRNLSDKAKKLSEPGGVKALYDRGAERAKSYARAAKLSLEINGEGEELRKVYTEIGKLFYEQNAAAPGAIYAGLFSRADELRASLREKEEELHGLSEVFESDKDGDLPTEIGDFEDIVNATEQDGRV